MVTNLPAEARAQWKRVMEAKSPEEKLEELKKFYSLIPKHKGTKNLVRSVRTQMARLREEIEEKKRKKAGGYISPWTIPRSGDIRVVVISNDYMPLVLFLDKTLNIPDKYMIWKLLPTHYNKIINDIEIEFIVSPPLGIMNNIDQKIIGLFNSSEYVLAVSNSIDGLNEIKNKLNEYGVEIVKRPIKIKVIKTPSGGIRINYIDPKLTEKIRNLLRGYGIYNAIVNIEGEISSDLFEDLFLGIKKYFKGGYYIWSNNGLVTTDKEFIDLKYIGTHLLNEIELIRVYPVRDLKQTVERPIILKRGMKVKDLAGKIHSDIQKHLKFAVVKRGNNILRVSGSFELQDGDIVTLRTK